MRVEAVVKSSFKSLNLKYALRRFEGCKILRLLYNVVGLLVADPAYAYKILGTRKSYLLTLAKEQFNYLKSLLSLIPLI